MSIGSLGEKAIESLNRGAKLANCYHNTGEGGVLPGKKVTAQIASIRRVKIGEDCIPPNGHSEFTDAHSLILFIEKIAAATGLPVGIKSAIGQLDLWNNLADEMIKTHQGPDWITIDGGEGGTGAAPLIFADDVALP